MDKPVYVIGHKNPDADSICAAIAYSALKNKLGLNTVAARLSAVNKETLYPGPFPAACADAFDERQMHAGGNRHGRSDAFKQGHDDEGSA